MMGCVPKTQDGIKPGDLVAYVVTNKMNNKKYVGITYRAETRFRQHWRSAVLNWKARHVSSLHRAIAKSGIENFRFEIVACAKNWEQLLSLEILLIDQLQTYAPLGKGYNLTLGGQGAFGAKHSEETKAKMRGRVCTPETRSLLRERKLGVMPSNLSDLIAALKGREVTETTRRRIGEGNKGKFVSPETIERLRASHLGKVSGRARRVLTPKGEFPSARQAAAAFEMPAASVCYRLNQNLEGWSWHPEDRKVVRTPRKKPAPREVVEKMAEAERLMIEAKSANDLKTLGNILLSVRPVVPYGYFQSWATEILKVQKNTVLVYMRNASQTSF